MAKSGWVARLSAGWGRLQKQIRMFFQGAPSYALVEEVVTEDLDSAPLMSLLPVNRDNVPARRALPSPLPNWMVKDVAQRIRRTSNVALLEYLMNHPLEAGADRSLWRGAWKERAFDWRNRMARRVVWDALLREPMSEELLTEWIVAALEHESDWYVLQSLAEWRPASHERQEVLRRAWERNVESPLPSRRLSAEYALERLGVLHPAGGGGCASWHGRPVAD